MDLVVVLFFLVCLVMLWKVLNISRVCFSCLVVVLVSLVLFSSLIRVVML